MKMTQLRKIIRTLAATAAFALLANGLLPVAVQPARAIAGHAQGQVFAAPTKKATREDLTNFVRNVIRAVVAGVGVALVTAFAWSGFRYLTAGDNSNQVSEAKSQMGNVFFALVIFMFSWAIINWLTPGGIGL